MRNSITYVALLNKIVSGEHSQLKTEKLLIIVTQWQNTWSNHCLIILECYYFKGNSRKNSECRYVLSASSNFQRNFTGEVKLRLELISQLAEI